MKEFIIYSENDSLIFNISDDNDISKEVLFNFLAVFGNVKKNERKIELGLFKLNQNHKDQIESITKQYEKINPKINQLNQFIKNIPNGEHCLIYPAEKQALDVSVKTYCFIKYLNQGLNEKEACVQMEKEMSGIHSNFGEILNNYNVSVINPRTLSFFGPKNKSERVCRFCMNSIATGVTFNDIAHTIPESLGNKKIVTNDECDVCNHNFSKTLDIDVFEYFKIYRVLFGKRGKNGIPKLEYKNKGEIRYENTYGLIQTETFIEKENESFETTLSSLEGINNANIYRSFVKFVMGIIDNQYLEYFQNTIKWINNIKNDGTKYIIPKIAMTVNNKYIDQPIMSIYIRKNTNKEVPYCFAELHITQFIIVFIIPFCSEDTIDFTQEEHFNTFWTLCKHYSSLKNWTFHEFNYDKKMKYNLNINFVKAQK